MIITLFLLSLSGCGYKKNPYYKEKVPASDENVKFTIKEPIVPKIQAVEKE